MEQKRLKVGIIGCGGIANGKHMPSIKAVNMSDMVAFCDLIEERAVKAAKEYGVPGAKVYTDYKELLADPEIDVVHVCTPNRSHAEISIDALHAGKHVMCEKPMAKCAADARLMVKAAQETGKKLTIGYQHRHKASAQYLKSIIGRGDLGDMYYAEALAVRRRGTPNWGVFLNEYEQGGGPLIDIGTHALDLTLWTMNNYKPKYVVGTVYHKLNNDRETGNAWGDWDPEKFTTEDSAFGFIVMENGATIDLSASWALNTLDVEEARTMLCGTKAGADMHNGELHINGVKHGKQYVTTPNMKKKGVDFYEGSSDDPKVMEQRVFVDAVRGEGELTVKPEQAFVVTQILDAIYQSAKTGKPVYFND